MDGGDQNDVEQPIVRSSQSLARKSWLDKAQSKYVEAQRKTLIENLMKYDVEGNGSFKIEQVADIVQSLMNEKKETKRKNKIIFLLVIALILFTVTVFCVTIVANEVTKETRVDKDNLLKTIDGNIVSAGTVIHHHELNDLLNLEPWDAMERLERMNTFTVKKQSGDLIWLKPTAFTIDMNDNEDAISKVVIHASFSEYSLMINETDYYYQNGSDVWYQAPENETTGGDGTMNSLRKVSAKGFMANLLDSDVGRRRLRKAKLANVEAWKAKKGPMASNLF